MMASTVFITKQPVLTFFALTFAISWGGFVLVVTIFVFTPAGTGTSFLIYTSALAGAMWIVAAVALASSGQLFRQPFQRRIA